MAWSKCMEDDEKRNEERRSMKGLQMQIERASRPDAPKPAPVIHPRRERQTWAPFDPFSPRAAH